MLLLLWQISSSPVRDVDDNASINIVLHYKLIVNYKWCLQCCAVSEFLFSVCSATYFICILQLSSSSSSIKHL